MKSKEMPQPEIINNSSGSGNPPMPQSISENSSNTVINNNIDQINNFIEDRDITAQKKAEQLIRESEERIRESEERLRLAVEIAELGMWDLDLSTGLTTTSPEHRKILGYTKTEQWSKVRFLEMVHPADRSWVEQAMQAALKTGKISYEARIIRTDNSERWIRVNGTTIYEQIFIIFQRLNNLKTYNGTGIGLALCKKIVDHHDGIITAESDIGQGATFKVILPVN